ncbi:MAG: type II toxin-antitoxin system VapC family toxin [Polyangiales bacterium]
MIFLDTCALLWWTLAPKHLSDKAQRALDEAMEHKALFVSSISFWEIGIKVQRRRLSIGCSIEEYSRRVQSLKTLHVLDVTLSDWLQSLALQWEHRDPADRVIVASAMARTWPLVTKDAHMLAYYAQALW